MEEWEKTDNSDCMRCGGSYSRQFAYRQTQSVMNYENKFTFLSPPGKHGFLTVLVRMSKQF